MNTRDWAANAIFAFPILSIAAMGAIDLLGLTVMFLDWLYRTHRLTMLLPIIACVLIIIGIVLLTRAKHTFDDHRESALIRHGMACCLGGLALLVAYAALYMLGT